MDKSVSNDSMAEFPAFLDIPDADSESDSEYWTKHAKISLQSMKMGFNNVARVIEVCDSEALIYLTNQIVPMVREFNKIVSDRTDKLNLSRKYGIK